MLDICLCTSEECKFYKVCLRGGATKRIGICTVSHLSEVCNNQTDYKEFIPGDVKINDINSRV